MKKALFSTFAATLALSAHSATQVLVVQDVPMRLSASSDTQINDSYVLEEALSQELKFLQFEQWLHYDHKWTEGAPGSGTRSATSAWKTWGTDGSLESSDSASRLSRMSWNAAGVGTEIVTESDGSSWTNIIGAPGAADTYCLVSAPWKTDKPSGPNCSAMWDYEGGFPAHSQDQQYFRYGQTKWTLQTGGSAFGKPRKRLWRMTANATKYVIKRPPLWLCGETVGSEVPPAQIKVLGHELYPDYSYWVELDDFQEVDATPVVENANYYTFSVGAKKHSLYVSANGISINDQSLLQPQFLFCIGQQVGLSAYFIPALQGVDTIQYDWTASGDSVNQAVGPNAVGCVTYTTDPAKWKLENPAAWWLTGGSKDIQVKLKLIFTNSQTLTISDSGKFGMAEPEVVSTTTSCGGVNIFTNGSSLLEIALRNSAGLGMDIINRVRRPDSFAGQAWHTQLIKRRTTYDTGVSSPSENTGGFWLDNVNPYKSPVSLPLTTHVGAPTSPFRDILIPDSPGLVAGMFGFSSYAEVEDDFHAYLMWKPNGNGSIPVPLGVNDWGWHGRAEKSGGAWSLTISNWYGTTFTAGRDYPYWENVYQNN